MALPIVNTREDLDKLKETDRASFLEFTNYLSGTRKRKVDVAVYPDDYNTPGFEGDRIEPIWEEVESLYTIQRFGFETSADFDAYLNSTKNARSKSVK